MSIPPPPQPPAGPPGPPAGLPVAPAPHVPGPHVPGPAGAAVTAGAAPAAAAPLAVWQAAVAVAAGLALVGGIGWAGISAVKAFDAATPTAAPTAAAPVPAPTDPGDTPDGTPGATPSAEPTPGASARVDLVSRPTTWRVSAADVAGKDIGERYVSSASLLDDHGAPTPTLTIFTTSTDDEWFYAGVDLATGEVVWRKSSSRIVSSCTVIDTTRAACDVFNMNGPHDILIVSLADGATLGTMPLDGHSVLGAAPHPDGLLVAVQADCIVRLMVVADSGGEPLRTSEVPHDDEDACGSDMMGGIKTNERWVYVGTFPYLAVADRTTLELVATEHSVDGSIGFDLVGADGWARSGTTSTIIRSAAVDTEFPGSLLRSYQCVSPPTIAMVGDVRVPLDGSAQVTVPNFPSTADPYLFTACDWGVVVDPPWAEEGRPTTVIDPSGATLWSADLGGSRVLLAGADGIVVEREQDLRAVRTSDGAPLWSITAAPRPEEYLYGEMPRTSAFGSAAVVVDGVPFAEVHVFPTAP